MVQLVAQTADTAGYINYVFKILGDKEAQMHNTKYITCTRFPNWEFRHLTIGERGYVEIQQNLAGRSFWYNGETMVPYNYDSLQFIKFCNEKETKEINEVKI